MFKPALNHPSIILRGLFTLTLALTLVSPAHTQDPCSDVIIHSILIDALHQDDLVIHVENNSEDIFSYPGFRVFNEGGIQVAEEEVTYFGIGQESIHYMHHNIEISPGETFPHTLELWTGFYDELGCTFQGEAILIPDQCADISFYFNAGASQFTESFTYEIVDDLEQVIESGSFTISPDQWYFDAIVCLDFGCYKLRVSTTDAMISNDLNFGAVHFFSDGTFSSVAEAGTTVAEMDFAVHQNCVITNKPEIEEINFSVHPNPTNQGVLNIFSSKPIQMNLFSPNGQLISEHSISGVFTIDVRDLSPGVYLLRSADGSVSEKVIITQ